MVVLSACATPASAAVLLVGYGSGNSAESAQTDAREDLAHRLQRLGARRLQAAYAQIAVSARRAFMEGRELPLIGIETVRAGADGAQQRYEARLTDASLAAYDREARRLTERLRKLDPARSAEGFAWLDQYRRIDALLSLFSSAVRPGVEGEETALVQRTVKNVSPLVSTRDAARRVKAELDRANVSGVRVIAPVRADNLEVTGLSGSIADELRSLVTTPGEAARYTLDGRYERIDGRILLTLFLMDATYNTERVFMFALPAATEQSFRALPGTSKFAEALSRGLVRVDSLDQGAGPNAGVADNVMGVDVRTERGKRGLYYRPGDRDQLLVKLDRPGYYYIVGHVEKANTHFSYLMEIGEPGGNRFVRRVSAEGANRWQPIGEFTVEPPLGLEALQVLATSEPPDRALPSARLDPVRKLYMIGTDPIDAIKRTRGLVLVNMAGAAAQTGPGKDAAQPAVGEAVLQFSTLQ